MIHKLPVPSSCVITQTYAEHVSRAKQMGCCSQPGNNCGCYYYGGVDFAPVPSSIPVVHIYASMDGSVQCLDQGNIGYGLHIKQTNGNTLVVYGHMKQLLVKSGDVVKQGDAIGIMGTTGFSTGRHLHWEIRINGKPVDPMPLLQVDPAPPPEPPPPTPPPAAFVMPNIPALPTAVCRVSPLRIRSAPVDGKTVGLINAGMTVYVIGAKIIGNDVWFLIISDELNPHLVGWSAAFYQGATWIEAKG